MRNMVGYCHQKNYELRYSDFDFKDELKFSSLLALVQESACLSADELGFGYGALRKQGLAFLIVGTYCRLLRPIVLGDALCIETWPLPPRHVFCERDYRVKDAKGEPVALLASRWCLVDLQDFSLITPDRLGKTHADCPYNPERSVEVPAWKIPPLRGTGRECGTTIVTNSRCDHYYHANNTYYADFFLDGFSIEEVSRRRIEAFQISYVSQAKEGTQLQILRCDDERGSRLEAHDADGLVAQCSVCFSDGEREGEHA